MTLQTTEKISSKALFILCNMGMTGFFEVSSTIKDRHHHAHLCFHATDGTVLSFVDVRRFGTWRCLSGPDWPIGRGPDPVADHAAFRLGVVAAVSSRPHLFQNKPICQVMHDQSLFNGIGNYLRAEILFRAGVPPFAPAKEVLGKLSAAAEGSPLDILTLCRDVPKEVIDMRLSKYQGGPAAGTTDTSAEHERWQSWLRVYSHDDASWAVDQEGRRIWFRGPPGKLYQKFAKKVHLVKSKSHKRPSATMASLPSNAAKRSSKDFFAGTPAAIRKKPAAGIKGRLASRKRPAAASVHGQVKHKRSR